MVVKLQKENGNQVSEDQIQLDRNWQWPLLLKTCPQTPCCEYINDSESSNNSFDERKTSRAFMVFYFKIKD